MGAASPHPDQPGLRGGARHAGSGLRGHTCVLSMTGSVRVTCGALPARPGGAGLVSGDSGPGTGMVLSNLPARGSNREGPDLGLASLSPGQACCVLSPTLGQRPLSPGQPAGPAKATSGRGHTVYACAGVRDAHCLCLCNNRGSALSPRSGAGPKMATWFSVAFPVEHGSWEGPSPPRGPGRWRLCQAIPGMELPAFLVRRVASESYLLCLWHQLVSWSRGGVRETRARGPEDPPGLLPSCSVALPPPTPSFLGTTVSEPELPSPDAQVSRQSPTPSPYRQKDP